MHTRRLEAIASRLAPNICLSDRHKPTRGTVEGEDVVEGCVAMWWSQLGWSDAFHGLGPVGKGVHICSHIQIALEAARKF